MDLVYNYSILPAEQIDLKQSHTQKRKVSNTFLTFLHHSTLTFNPHLHLLLIAIVKVYVN